MRLKRAYIAGPYRADTYSAIEQNIEEAKGIAKALWGMGYTVYCPHANTAHFDGIVEEEAFLDGHLEWVRVSELVVMHPRWQESEGACAERTEAHCELIPVWYLS